MTSWACGNNLFGYAPEGEGSYCSAMFDGGDEEVEGEGRGWGLGGGDGSTRLILRRSISVDLCEGDPMSSFSSSPTLFVSDARLCVCRCI